MNFGDKPGVWRSSIASVDVYINRCMLIYIHIADLNFILQKLSYGHKKSVEIRARRSPAIKGSSIAHSVRRTTLETHADMIIAHCQEPQINNYCTQKGTNCAYKISTGLI